jgi:glyoxylase-like metal-dependent hydrolase (beta-lactamase superfamily II)
MPCDYSLYPADWFAEVRPRILARAGDRCEECGIANGNYRWYWTDDLGDGWSEVGPEEAARLRGEGRSVRRVVLTISHTDHDVTNNDDSNLRALCQRCHNWHDRDYRRRNAAATRRRRKVEAVGQQMLPMEADYA